MSDRSVVKPIGAFVAVSAILAQIYTGACSVVSTLRRWWLNRDESRRALAALDDDQLCNLSDLGRQIRREERQAEHWR
jgi:uncharacterized protein YjiS (DUF1127 family)